MGEYYDAYWKKSSLLWERTIYDKKPAGANLEERIAGLFRRSILIDRRDATIRYLKDNINDRTFVDLGCAGGYLCNALLNAGAKKVIGIDISESVIEDAKKRFKDIDIPPERFTFLVANVNSRDFSLPPSDFVVSLGLIEYLSRLEAESLFAKLKGRSIFVAYEETSWFNIIAFCHCIYRKIKGFPYLTSFTKKELADILKRYGFGKIRFYRSGNNTFVSAVPGSNTVAGK